MGNSAPVFPATLKKFNAGEVDGEYYDCIIPDSVTQLQTKAFSGTSITSLYVGKQVSDVRTPSPFLDCKQLTKATVAGDTPVPFTGCDALTDLRILGNQTVIPNQAYMGMSNITSFEVASTITKIGSSAFANCKNLESFKIDGQELLTIGESAFSGAEKLKTLELPDSITDIGAGAFAGTGIESIVLPANLWKDMRAEKWSEEPMYGDFTVGRTACLFAGKDASGNPTANDVIKFVDLSKYQQTYLPSRLFLDCTALESIVLPKNVNRIMAGAFEGCTALKSVYYLGDQSQLSISESGVRDHALGYKYYAPGAFDIPDGGTDPTTGGATYKPITGITFYGLGMSDAALGGTNKLKEYAEKTGNTWKPFAFLGEGGQSAEVQAKFGYAIPASAYSLSVSNVDLSKDSAAAPAFVVNYPGEDGISRTLVPGEDCTVTYKDADGNVVTTFEYNGTYTAEISGDGQSVWGTTTATFTVTGAKDKPSTPDPTPTPNPGQNQGQGGTGQQPTQPTNTTQQVAAKQPLPKTSDDSYAVAGGAALAGGTAIAIGSAANGIRRRRNAR